MELPASFRFVKLLASTPFHSLHLPPEISSGVDLILARSGVQLHVAIEVGFDALILRSSAPTQLVAIHCIRYFDIFWILPISMPMYADLNKNL